MRIYIRVLAFKCGNEVAFLYDQRIPLSRAAVTFSAGCDQIRHILIEYMAMWVISYEISSFHNLMIQSETLLIF